MTTEERLTKLEKRIGLYRNIAVLLAALLTVALLAGADNKADQPGVVNATQFNLIDKKGRTAAVLGFVPVQLPATVGGTVGTTDGEVREAPSLTFWNADPLRGMDADTLAPDEESKALLKVAIEYLKHATVEITGGPSPSIKLAAEDLSSPRVEMTGGPSPSINLYDDKAGLRTALGCTDLTTIKTGETTGRVPSSLVLFDKDGKVIWQAP